MYCIISLWRFATHRVPAAVFSYERIFPSILGKMPIPLGWTGGEKLVTGLPRYICTQMDLLTLCNFV